MDKGACQDGLDVVRLGPGQGGLHQAPTYPATLKLVAHRDSQLKPPFAGGLDTQMADNELAVLVNLDRNKAFVVHMVGRAERARLRSVGSARRAKEARVPALR
jgi:hypothetical protein